MKWEEIHWPVLERLRDRFLQERPGAGGDYWRSPQELENYDLTFARRIAWKWDSVLGELKAMGWSPPENAALLDWGCGTGIATRRLLASWPDGPIRRSLVWDRSSLAMGFARGKIESESPSVRSGEWDGSLPTPDPVLLVSHVLNELTPEGERGLLALARRAETLIWVEPGTPALSRRLIDLREQLRDLLIPLAPCPHSDACGLLSPGNERHWCHHFARPPDPAFQDANWAKLGRRLGIDLRSLPVSYLVLSRRQPREREDRARLLGRARSYKGYSQALFCTRAGVRERKLLHREHRDLARQLERGEFSTFIKC